VLTKDRAKERARQIMGHSDRAPKSRIHVVKELRCSACAPRFDPSQ
jgi:hypothetical protein